MVALMTMMEKEKAGLTDRLCLELRNLKLPTSVTNQHGWVRGFYLGGAMPEFVPCPKATDIIVKQQPSNMTVGEWLDLLDRVEGKY